MKLLTKRQVNEFESFNSWSLSKFSEASHIHEVHPTRYGRCDISLRRLLHLGPLPLPHQFLPILLFFLPVITTFSLLIAIRRLTRINSRLALLFFG